MFGDGEDTTDWDDLVAYCRYSASPVGRQLLDLHGESRETWPASDALCSALQVLNHLQDCADDYRRLDRAARTSCPGLRRVIDGMLDSTDALVEIARGLPAQITSFGLRRESAVIVGLAVRLLRLLRRGDPLAARVKLRTSDCVAAVVSGVSGFAWR